MKSPRWPQARHRAGLLRGAISVSGCALFAVAACGRSEQPPPQVDRPTVVVTPVVERTVPVYADHVGQTRAVESVEIRARVEGFLQRVAFTDGTLVDRGQLLFVIDRQPFEHALRQAEAQLAQDQAALERARRSVEEDAAKAQLAQAEAALQKAEQSQELQEAEAQLARDEATLVRTQRDAARARQLFDQQLIAAAALDAAVAADQEAAAGVNASRAGVAQARVNQRNAVADARAAVEAGRAAVTQARVTQRSAIDQATAAIAADRAAIAQAQLNLGYATISSPLAGLIGRTNIDVGSFVGRGEPTLLATVSKIDPIDVSFSTTERQYLEATKQLAGGKPALKGLSGKITATILLADGSPYPPHGVVNFVDRAVNPDTNTLEVRARFPNPNGLLRPGGNVRVRVQLTEATNARLIPQRAVQQGQEGTSVYVVSADGTVERRTVETGARYGNLWVIDRGLDAGESVVVEGVQKIRPGVKVATTPAPAEEPTPAPPAGTQRGS